MTSLCELSLPVKTLLPILLFLAALCEIVLVMLNKTSRSMRSVHTLICAGAAAVLSVITNIYSANVLAPVLPAAAALIAALIHIPAEAVLCMKYRKNHLSSYAVKEAVDDLPTGVCFADASGRIILCNRRMGSLAYYLLGSYPQTAEELEKALSSPAEKGGVSVIQNEPVLHGFPDGTVWRFRIARLSDGICQFTAQNVTAIHEINENLRADNEELKKVNRRLRRMYDRLADRIREEETLDLKMRIHDNIGASLIAVSEILNGDMDKELDKQLAVLENAVSYLTDSRPAPRGTFEEAVQKAEIMKVRLVLKGSIPQNTSVESLMSRRQRNASPTA